MGSGPSTVNKPAQTADQIIHAAIFDVAIRGAITALIAVPYLQWLGLPLIKQIFTAAMNYLGGFIYTYLSEIVTFAIIDLQTAQEKSAYQKAEAALRIAHLSGDPNGLAQATKDFRAALGALIHFDGSATP